MRRNALSRKCANEPKRPINHRSRCDRQTALETNGAKSKTALTGLSGNRVTMVRGTCTLILPYTSAFLLELFLPMLRRYERCSRVLQRLGNPGRPDQLFIHY